MDYSTGSAEADKKLAKSIKGAREGIPRSHAYLGKVYCGELCYNKNPNLREDYKLLLAKSLKKIQDLQVEVDYVKSYAHYILADEFKISYESTRNLLEKHMNKEQLEQAKALAKKWKSQFNNPE